MNGTGDPIRPAAGGPDGTGNGTGNDSGQGGRPW